MINTETGTSRGQTLTENIQLNDTRRQKGTQAVERYSREPTTENQSKKDCRAGIREDSEHNSLDSEE